MGQDYQSFFIICHPSVGQVYILSHTFLFYATGDCYMTFMTFVVTPYHLFWAFLFATAAFVVFMFIIRGWKRDLTTKIAALTTELVISGRKNDDLQHKIDSALSELEIATKGRNKLQKSIDHLIMRRDDLLACLKAARDDQERVACILKLMDIEDDTNGM